MSFFQKHSFVAVDLETTGIDPEKDRIIEFAGVLVEDGKVVKQLEFVINPGIPISSKIQAITGITNAEVQGKPQFCEVQKEIQEFVDGHIIVGHNILFDLAFLEKNGVQSSGKYLDTYTLSSLFFHAEKSLALEVLSEVLQIEHQYKHRALGDILATVELLKIIYQRIRALPQDVLEQIKTFLEKQNTPLKLLFQEIQFSILSQNASSRIDFGFTKLHPVQQTQLQEIIDINAQHLILESPNQTQTIQTLLPLLQGKNILAFYSPKLINKIDAFLQKVQPENYCILKNRHNYLCLQKFQKFCEKPNLSETEIGLIIKILIWLHSTVRGDRDEIALTYDEYPLWHGELCSNDSCSGAEHLDCFWHIQKKKIQTSTLVLTYHNLLLEEKFSADFNLIICEARDLEKSITAFGSSSIKPADFTEILTKFSQLPELTMQKTQIHVLLENLQLLWGYLYRELTQKLTDFQYPQKIVLSNSLKAQTGFLQIRQRFRAIFIEMEEILQSIEVLTAHKFRLNQLRNLVQDTQTFFDEWQENEIRFFQVFPSGELEMGIEIIDLKPFSLQIFQTYARVIALDENLATLDGTNTYSLNYWKKSLGVEELAWKEKILSLLPSQKAKIDLEFLSQANHQQNILARTCDLIKTTVLKNQGRTLVLFTSYANLELYFEALALDLQTLGYKVLPQGNGGVKKLKKIFEQFPEKSVIFGIERSFHREFFETKNLKTVILHKLVFDFPNDPLVLARQAQYQNSFMEFSLPRSILSFKQSYLKLQSEDQVFIPLDNRLTEKQYGKYFLASLEKL